MGGAAHTLLDDGEPSWRVLPSAQADTYLRAFGSKVATVGVAVRPIAGALLLQIEQRVCLFIWRFLSRNTHVKVRLTVTE